MLAKCMRLLFDEVITRSPGWRITEAVAMRGINHGDDQGCLTGGANCSFSLIPGQHLVMQADRTYARTYMSRVLAQHARSTTATHAAIRSTSPVR